MLGVGLGAFQVAVVNAYGKIQHCGENAVHYGFDVRLPFEKRRKLGNDFVKKLIVRVE